MSMLKFHIATNQPLEYQLLVWFIVNRSCSKRTFW